MADGKSLALYEKLDTSFVNLWALLRYLSQRGFIGRVHVELKDYTADVLLDGSSTPMVRELEHATGIVTLEEAALHRLVLRVREAPGTISVYEGLEGAETPVDSPEVLSILADEADEETLPRFAHEPTKPMESFEGATLSGDLRKRPSRIVVDMASPGASEAATEFAAAKTVTTNPAVTDIPSEPIADFREILDASGELIAAVERALIAVGVEFGVLFGAVRLEVADDYDFLDPTNNVLQYANAAVKLQNQPPAKAYVAGISELLRRMVDRVATGERARRVRERVALEMALLARKHDLILTRSGFRARLDSIAGTRVV
jgi:hypothetical protein